MPNESRSRSSPTTAYNVDEDLHANAKTRPTSSSRPGAPLAPPGSGAQLQSGSQSFRFLVAIRLLSIVNAEDLITQVGRMATFAMNDETNVSCICLSSVTVLSHYTRYLFDSGILTVSLFRVNGQRNLPLKIVHTIRQANQYCAKLRKIRLYLAIDCFSHSAMPRNAQHTSILDSSPRSIRDQPNPSRLRRDRMN